MPDKDGDEGKSTKSVVNKKQKQMMGEEGYDIARDMGRVRPSKDKKDATTMPPSKEMEKTRKVNKGSSALDIVKKKYKGQIMKMEELDLTKVAESFGGHIVEARKINKKIGTVKPGEKEATTAAVRTAAEKPQLSPEGEKRLEKISKKSVITKDTVSDFKKKLDQLKSGSRPVDDSTIRGMGTETDREFDSRSQLDKSDAARRSYNRIARELRRPEYANPEKPEPQPEPQKDPVKRGRPVGSKSGPRGQRAERDPEIAAMTPGQKERNIRQIKKDIDARNPTIQTQVGPVPYRNRRVPKTRTLVPVFDRTPEIMKPDTDELLKFKDFRKKTKTTTAELDKNQEFKAPPIPQTQTEVPPPPPPNNNNRRRKTGEFDGSRAFNSIKKFAKDNPAAALATYDIGKGILGKIKKYSKAAIKSLNVEKPTKTGRISAGT